ncbi:MULTISPECIES: alpha/beta fold hydrolase [Streptomycetaceae]|uniref:Putative hydrolase, alpha/beta fold protein n=1 Tax=Streptantibioticus cattleyicolor (strain ATCC 35852 / DSM 46488 / JCM 4925 / NBRC 14057 / NRRL 8057) TaxID=1003195 RepID=F8K3V0_STREN|nr:MULTISPECIES: alpha/beta fold hydrolase [Streptomycetaceae]AEW97645.1 putative hydrolase, alpha/beta fold protein [Streptantibioticus cattleyicolor NRRL 8057 = DSM 46488]MYS62073.1 alpha/beta fold hydrolase [Streptomyces sp. SID5468]CCB77966.1 putative hydrolase, alpha/beta fold [Streptantibioticus cattleyicolor NRRL 8057 = DSM 46488]
MATAHWLDDVTEKLIPTSLGLINVREGGRADGPAMVCWPSLMMDGTMWRYQYEHFAPTHRMVLVDSPGHGRSDALRKLIDLKDCADALTEVLDALAIDRCVLVGNSWGGMLAGVFPAYHPERTTAAVGINCTASLPTMFESVWATALAGYLSVHARMPELAARAARAAFAGPTAEAERPEFVEFTRSVLVNDPKSVAWALRSILIGRKDEHRRLATVPSGIPVLVIAGEEDSQFPVHAVRRMADAIPGGVLRVLPHTAHLAARENPDAVNAEIDAFLAALPAAA